MPYRGTPAAFELTVTMAPRRRGAMRRATARDTLKTPRAFTSNTCVHVSSSVSTTSVVLSTPDVGQAVDRSPVLLAGGGGCLDGAAVGHVEPASAHADVWRSDRCGQTFGRLAVEVEGGHVCPLVGQRAHDGGADAAGGAGNDCDPAGKS